MDKYLKDKIDLANLKGEVLAIITLLKNFKFVEDPNSLEFLDGVASKIKNLEIVKCDDNFSIKEYLDFMEEVEDFKKSLKKEYLIYWEMIGVEVLWRRIYISILDKTIDFKNNKEVIDYLYNDLKDDIYILKQLMI